MPLYRMIAIDLDGTLLMPDGSVSPRNKAAVHRVLKAGLLVCFATGRNWTESETILSAVEHYDTTVFVGGAMVVDTKNRVMLHRMGMQPHLAREVCDLMESLGHAALVLQDTHKAGCDYLVTDGIELNSPTRQWMKVTSATVHRITGLGSTYPHEHTIRVGIVAPREEVARAREALIRQLGDKVVCHCLWVPAYGVEVMEVFDPAVNKWEGVLHVARRHGITPQQIVAIGDDENDVAMISNAGLGVAMGNAKPQVQAIANRVIKPNTEDGLAQFLEELVETHMVQPEGAANG